MLIDRSIRPASGPDVNFTPPRIHKFSLKNGLNIFLSKKTDLPIVRLNLLINGGSKFDSAIFRGFVINLGHFIIDTH